MATLPLKNRQRDFGSHSVSIRDELDLALNPQMVGQRWTGQPLQIWLLARRRPSQTTPKKNLDNYSNIRAAVWANSQLYVVFGLL